MSHTVTSEQQGGRVKIELSTEQVDLLTDALEEAICAYREDAERWEKYRPARAKFGRKQIIQFQALVRYLGGQHGN